MQQLFLGLQLVSRIFEEEKTIRNPNQNRAARWRILLQIKVYQPIGRKDSTQTGI